MTKEEALTMIIASIAMEELALSHIVNAEGEKLQYILGTLPNGPRPCVDTEEILAVNKSVKALLDTVAQSQMLLKGKLETALEAGGHEPPPKPCPPGKPPCACPPEKPPCACCPGKPPCACHEKSAIQLISRGSGFSWCGGTPMSWKCLGRKGDCIDWNENAPAIVRLDPSKAYALHYTINVCGSFPGDRTGTIRVQLTPGNAFFDALPLHFYIKCLDCKPQTLHDSAMLFPQARPMPNAGLSLILQYKDSLFVDRASLSIIEL